MYRAHKRVMKNATVDGTVSKGEGTLRGAWCGAGLEPNLDSFNSLVMGV